MVSIEIKITFESAGELDPETQEFLKALAKSSNIVKVISDKAPTNKTITVKKEKTSLRNLSEFGLPNIIINRFEENRIYYIEDIVRFRPRDLLYIRHFGPGRLKEFFTVLQKWQAEHPDENIKKWLDRHAKEIDSM